MSANLIAQLQDAERTRLRALNEAGLRCTCCGSEDKATLGTVYEDDQPTTCWSDWHGEYAR